jgi:hypothetical protein
MILFAIVSFLGTVGTVSGNSVAVIAIADADVTVIHAVLLCAIVFSSAVVYCVTVLLCCVLMCAVY